jgi:hypothetical protein
MAELRLGNIKPAGDDNVVVDGKYVKGGYVVVSSVTERDALKGPNGKNIVKGSLCYCTADATFYQYDGSKWVEPSFSNGGGQEGIKVFSTLTEAKACIEAKNTTAYEGQHIIAGDYSYIVKKRDKTQVLQSYYEGDDPGYNYPGLAFDFGQGKLFEIYYDNNNSYNNYREVNLDDYTVTCVERGEEYDIPESTGQHIRYSLGYTAVLHIVEYCLQSNESLTFATFEEAKAYVEDENSMAYDGQLITVGRNTYIVKDNINLGRQEKIQYAHYISELTDEELEAFFNGHPYLKEGDLIYEGYGQQVYVVHRTDSGALYIANPIYIDYSTHYFESEDCPNTSNLALGDYIWHDSEHYEDCWLIRIFENVQNKALVGVGTNSFITFEEAKAYVEAPNTDSYVGQLVSVGGSTYNVIKCHQTTTQDNILDMIVCSDINTISEGELGEAYNGSGIVWEMSTCDLYKVSTNSNGEYSLSKFGRTINDVYTPITYSSRYYDVHYSDTPGYYYENDYGHHLITIKATNSGMTLFNPRIVDFNLFDSGFFSVWFGSYACDPIPEYKGVYAGGVSAPAYYTESNYIKLKANYINYANIVSFLTDIRDRVVANCIPDKMCLKNILQRTGEIGSIEYCNILSTIRNDGIAFDHYYVDPSDGYDYIYRKDGVGITFIINSIWLVYIAVPSVGEITSDTVIYVSRQDIRYMS